MTPLSAPIQLYYFNFQFFLKCSKIIVSSNLFVSIDFEYIQMSFRFLFNRIVYVSDCVKTLVVVDDMEEDITEKQLELDNAPCVHLYHCSNFRIYTAAVQRIFVCGLLLFFIWPHHHCLIICIPIYHMGLSCT